MKTTFTCVCIFFLMVCCPGVAHAQFVGRAPAYTYHSIEVDTNIKPEAIKEPFEKYPYYTALAISEALKNNNPGEIIRILSKCAGGDTLLNPLDLQTKYFNNKFIQEVFFKKDMVDRAYLYKVASDRGNYKSKDRELEVSSPSEKKSVMKSIGALDATIFADAFAKIVVKRFKQDLNALFFEQMKAAMDSSVELKTLLPHTHQLLQLVDHDIYNFQTYIDGLREKLEEDFSNVFAGTNALLETPKYKLLFTKDVVVKSLISTMLQVSDGLVNKKHPGLIIEQLNLNNDYDTLVDGIKIKAGLQMLQLFSRGLQSKDTARYWIKGLDSLNLLFKTDTTVGKIWLGLLYESAKDVDISASVNNHIVTVRGMINKMSDQPEFYVQSKNFFSTFFNQVNQIELTFSDIKAAEGNGDKVNWSQIVSLYENAVSLIKLAPDFRTIFEPDYQPPRYWHRSLFIAETMPRIYAETKGKQYHSAVQHIAGLIKAFDFRHLYIKSETKIMRVDTMRNFFYVNEIGRLVPQSEYGELTGKYVKYGKDSVRIIKLFIDSAATKELDYRLMDKFLKYASFGASLIESRSSDEVAALLESTMIPPGGTRLKETGTMLGINGYLGLQHNFNAGDSSGFSSVSVPLGLNLSFGLSKNLHAYMSRSQKFWHFVSPHTVQVFASLVDIGALAGLRFTNNRSDIPKITLENIFSPGIFLQFGRLLNTPLNIGFGYQAQPRLYDISGQNLTLRPFVFRFNINASWDIPFWNLWFKAN